MTRIGHCAKTKPLPFLESIVIWTVWFLRLAARAFYSYIASSHDFRYKKHKALAYRVSSILQWKSHVHERKLARRLKETGNALPWLPIFRHEHWGTNSFLRYSVVQLYPTRLTALSNREIYVFLFYVLKNERNFTEKCPFSGS